LVRLNFPAALVASGLITLVSALPTQAEGLDEQVAAELTLNRALKEGLKANGVPNAARDSNFEDDRGLVMYLTLSTLAKLDEAGYKIERK
jgi:hypothetical protein